MGSKHDPGRYSRHAKAAGPARVAELKAAYEAGRLKAAVEWMANAVADRDRGPRRGG